MLKVGDKIPELEFEAYYNNDIKKFSFSEFRGKWLVLVFYPADFTFVCPTELGEFADLYEEFKKEGAEVLSISIDTVFVHKAWHDTSKTIAKIKFPMVADPTRKICSAFGTLKEDEGVSWRATFIIDPEGKIVHMELHDNSIGRNAKEILRRLKAAKFVRDHPGAACPASWEPGKEVLKPGLDLVGKL